MPRVKLYNYDDVLDKAMDLFWKKGYCATSMQDLVDHLGISRSSLYDTFGDKKTLFEKALVQYCSSNKSAIDEYFSSQKSVKKGLKNLFRSLISESVNDIDQKGCLVVNTTTELAQQDKQVKKY